MRGFRYWRDPLAATAVGLYACNEWGLKAAVHGGFLHNHFNDLLLVPAALPWVLWLQRRLGWRGHDGPPTWAEIALHLIVWSLVCEVLGPLVTAHAVGDGRDVVAYVAGAAVAGGWWRWRSSVAARRRMPEPALA